MGRCKKTVSAGAVCGESIIFGIPFQIGEAVAVLHPEAVAPDKALLKGVLFRVPYHLNKGELSVGAEHCKAFFDKPELVCASPAANVAAVEAVFCVHVVDLSFPVALPLLYHNIWVYFKWFIGTALKNVLTDGKYAVIIYVRKNRKRR